MDLPPIKLTEEERRRLTALAQQQGKSFEELVAEVLTQYAKYPFPALPPKDTTK